MSRVIPGSSTGRGRPSNPAVSMEIAKSMAPVDSRRRMTSAYRMASAAGWPCLRMSVSLRKRVCASATRGLDGRWGRRALQGSMCAHVRTGGPGVGWALGAQCFVAQHVCVRTHWRPRGRMGARRAVLCEAACVRIIGPFGRG
eukprot:363084-Chlamydomonas_euryale.AAC.7